MVLIRHIELEMAGSRKWAGEEKPERSDGPMRSICLCAI